MARGRSSRASSSGSLSTAQRVNSPMARPSSAGRPMPSPFQNGTAPGHARGGRDDHPVARDLLDPPGGGAEQEGLPRPRLVDHLLVELADAAPVREVHPVEPAVRDRPGVGHGQLAGALARADRVLDTVPDDPRAQLCELLAGVAAVEHVEHLVEQLPGQLAVGVGAPDHVVQLGHPPVLVHDHRHDLLGEHVERVAGHHGRLDLARPASASRPPRTRAGRRGTWGRSGPSRPRRRRGRRGRCAAARRSPTSATRPGGRGRPRPCRCRARASWWPPGTAARPT